MNKSKLPMPIRTRKKMDKQVKKDIQSASSEAPTTTTANDTSIAGLLSRLPTKLKKKKEALLGSFEKAFEAKKKKQAHKLSKRTNPGIEDMESSPRNVHSEGKRWIGVSNKQTKANNKIFNKSSLKKK